MGRAGRWAVLLALAACPVAGCAAKKPYAGHPLLRGGNGVWGDYARGRSPLPRPPEPEPPRPPPPTDLPTREWEAARAD